MGLVTEPPVLDETGKRIATALESISGSMSKSKAWATATDSEIARLVQDADNGDIDLYNDLGWRPGDTRTVVLSNGVRVELVLDDQEHYTFTNPLPSGRTACHFVVHFKDCPVTHYMNSSNTNSGSWDGCAQRTYLNGDFLNMIPTQIRSIFKNFNVVTAETYNGTTLKTSSDKLTLPAEKEIFGARTYSNETEANALTQLNYYATGSHRIKKYNGSACYWWERSPHADYANYFCVVNANGTPSYNSASNDYGVSPFGCI